MTIPERLNYLSDYIFSSFEKPEDRISAPLILQGGYGVGKSWVINQVFKLLRKKMGDTGVIPLFLPVQFSGVYLIDDIIQMIEVEKKKYHSQQKISNYKEKKLKYLLLIENIDKLFDLDFGEKGFALPARAKGAGVSKMNYIHQSSRLRSFLIENSKDVSLLATAVKLDFMNDADLPFYNFFNVVKIDSLEHKESADYVMSKLGENSKALTMFEFLSREFENSHLDITDGILGYLNLYVGTLLEISNIDKDFRFKELVYKFNSIYFAKLNHQMESSLLSLSFNEKTMLDYIVRTKTPFRVSDLRNTNLKNNSRVISSLKEKGVLVAHGEGRTATYNFASNAMRSWLDFHSMSKLL